MKSIHEMGELFEVVQMCNIYPDGKTFPDCLPKQPLSQILSAYERERDKPNFDLTAFVYQHFDLPKAYSIDFESDSNRDAEQHVNALWHILTRQPDNEKSSLIALPYPYIVPGGRFREIYYWDSYFTMLGLQASGRVDMIQNMVDNFSYLLHLVGHIPNGNRAYYIGRSQPPFFALMVNLLSEVKGGREIFLTYLRDLEKEYQFWMIGSAELSPSNNAVNRVVLMPDGSILNRYWDENNTPRPESYKEDVELAHHSAQQPEVIYRHIRAAAESGWDFSSRWFTDGKSFATIHTTDLIPVDLNCLLLYLEQTLAATYALKGDNIKNAFYQKQSEKRQQAIQKYCWNTCLSTDYTTRKGFYTEGGGFYCDFDFTKNELSHSYTLAGVFPLFFHVATPEQAASVADIIEKQFLKSGGVTTTLVTSGQQWDSPNGWAPLQWMTFKGLMNYGFTDLAQHIRQNWLNVNMSVYEKTGKMTEKYNVCNENAEAGGGEYPNQDGFGWTNGVFLAMLKTK